MALLPLSESIVTISQAEANAALSGASSGPSHYLGPIEYGARVILADRDDVTGKVCALAAFANPTAAHFTRKLRGSLELTRLWQDDMRRDRDLEFDRLSAFVLCCLDWVRREWPDCPAVFSYTDPSRGHDGGVYQWSGFTKLGRSRRTHTWADALGEVISGTKLQRLHGTRDRAALEALGYSRIEAAPKVAYVKGLTMTAAQVRDMIGGRYALKGGRGAASRRKGA